MSTHGWTTRTYLLPHEFPSLQTVYDQMWLWLKAGSFEAIVYAGARVAGLHWRHEIKFP